MSAARVFPVSPALFVFECPCKRHMRVDRVGRLNLVLDCPCGQSWVVIVERDKRKARIERLKEKAS